MLERALTQVDIDKQDKLVEQAEKFLKNDLIPCTPERLNVRKSIIGIKRFSETLQGDHQEMTINLAERLVKNSDAHFAKSK